MSGMIISTNILAMNAHRNVKGVGSNLSKASEKLSSGFRINRASDDAAGLAISEKMKAQIRGLQQAQQNTEDGVNLIKTADGAMSNIQEMMIRQRELLVQALNDTNTYEDKENIQQELDQITAEISSLSEKTTFNNLPLLNVPQDTSVSTDIAGPAPTNTDSIVDAITPLTASPMSTQTINLSTLRAGDSGVGWEFTGSVLFIKDAAQSEILELTGTMPGYNNRITVLSGVTAEIILKDVNVSTATGAALDMRGATVNLWLEGTSNLKSEGDENAGIETTDGILTIDGQGHLTAHSSNKAGIGGGQVSVTNDASGGTIIVNGGNVKAISNAGVGIGGGDHEDGTGIHQSAGRGANLVINGGIVEAIGSYPLSSSNEKIAIGGGGNIGGIAGGDGGFVIVNGGILIANGNIGGGFSSGSNSGGMGADVRVEGGLLQVTDGRIGGGSDFNGTVNGPYGRTTVIDGNLSIVNPGANIGGGVKNGSGDRTYAVQIVLYDPSNAQQLQFTPYTEMTYTLGTDTYTGITDKDGKLYMYLPNDSQGIQGTMNLGGKTYVGTLETMNADHLDVLVFSGNVIDPPDPPDPGDPPDPNDPPDLSKVTGDLWIQSGANSGQGVLISRYDCRPEALFKDVFDPNTITIEVDGAAKNVTLTKLKADPWEEATASLIAIDDAFNKVSSYRAKAGAQQNRLEFTSNFLGIAFTNLEDSHSRIKDADMAKEMMNLTKANVLQQAGTAMLAQANQAPQSVLQLLR